MANVVFYEKPGCINNTRQKRWLSASGHRVDARDLLAEPWTAQRLRTFFGKLPVQQWFNRTAPAITRGQVDPDAVDEEAALALMCEQPLLIRRPLMQVGEVCVAGFEPARVKQWIGLVGESADDLENCPRDNGACENKGEYR